MRNPKIRRALAALMLAPPLCLPMKTQAQTADGLMPSKTFKFSLTQKRATQFLYYLPPGYAPKSHKQWPLLLFLHGAGERGTNVQRVGIHGPLSLVKLGTNFPFIIVAPLCPAGKQWENDALLKLLDHVTREFAVDTSRIYLTGLSMGGYGTWRLGLAHPEKFAALAPICGGGEVIPIILAKNYETNKLAAMKALGVWAFHGGKDATVPPEESERMANALKKAGCADVKLTLYPEANHDSWTETYNHPELYEWLLKHSR